MIDHLGVVGGWKGATMFRLLLLLVVLVAARRASAGTGNLPCDIYAATGSPCVAAHSVARSLYSSYAGPLYAVTRASDGATKTIGVVTPGGVVDTAALASFCPAAEQCMVQRIFDQSPQGNHIAPVLPRAGPVNATKQAFTVGGRAVYGAVFEGVMGYRNDTARGLAVGDEPESIYMVRSSALVPFKALPFLLFP